MRYLISATLIIAGVIHLLPITGVVGAEQLAALYGIDVAGPDLALLMRHRAVVLAALGGFMLLAAFRPSLRAAAFGVGLLSAVSFLWLAWSIGEYNEKIARVVTADIVASICLVIGAVAAYVASRGVGSPTSSHPDD